MDHEIDRLSDLGFGIGEGALRVAAHHEIGEAMEGLFGGVCVDRCQRSGVARIEGIEQRSCFGSADFAEDDPVRTPAQRRLQKIVEGDAGLEGIGLAFGSQNVRLLDAQLSRILDDYDPLLVPELPAPRMFSRVVFPVPVPPLIRTVLPARICVAQESGKRAHSRCRER